MAELPCNPPAQLACYPAGMHPVVPVRLTRRPAAYLQIQINEFLLNLKTLVDWRRPALSMTLLLIISATTVLSIWVPFSQFLLYINGFLFVYWTWVWDYFWRLGLGPVFMTLKYFKVSLRYRQIPRDLQ